MSPEYTVRAHQGAYEVLLGEVVVRTFWVRGFAEAYARALNASAAAGQEEAK